MRVLVDRNTVNDLSNMVIGAAIEVHRVMGPGLMESVYEECLGFELSTRGIPVATQVPTPLQYKGHDLKAVYRADMIVDKHLLVEIKSVDKLAPIHDSQVLTYLKLADLPIGLLLNFNETLLKNGIKRLVNGF
jgi:GxxExxY protein